MRSIPVDNPLMAFIFEYILAPGMWIVTGLIWHVYGLSLVAAIVFPLCLGIVSFIVALITRYRKHVFRYLASTLKSQRY